MIEAQALTRRFGSFTAVDSVSLRIPDGALLALLGPNGAGKTTTVRMLSGLLAPTSGGASVAGIDVAADPAGVRARSGLVTDVPGLYERMTAPAYLDFFGAIYGLDAATRKARIGQLLGFFELESHTRETMVGFSKGMKQKVALARALLHEPAALFLDEPTSGLDPQVAHMVRGLILDLKQSSRSVILCTHDLDEAERLADEVAIIQNGRIIVSGSPADLRRGASAETAVRIDLAEPCSQAVEWLRSVDVSARDVSEGLVLEYRTADPREVNPRVLARLVEGGARVVSVTCDTSTLEDAYFRAVGAAS